MYKVVSAISRFQQPLETTDFTCTTPVDAWEHVCKKETEHRGNRRALGARSAGTQKITITYCNAVISKRELERRARAAA